MTVIEAIERFMFNIWEETGTTPESITLPYPIYRKLMMNVEPHMVDAFGDATRGAMELHLTAGKITIESGA